MPICCIIPARYNSKRLPGKPLLKIQKKEILLLTYEKAKKIFLEKNIYVFTDSTKVKKKLNTKIKNLIIFNKSFINGTSRASYGLRYIKKKYSGALILSCDNPFINDSAIKNTINCFKKIEKQKNYCAATIHCKKLKEKTNKNIAKLVISKNNDVLYISRSNIPFNPINKKFYLTHHGPVCIKIDHLRQYSRLKMTTLQKLEDNEWLNFIERGYKIKSFLVNNIFPEINTKNDLNYYRKKKK